jgi:transposase
MRGDVTSQNLALQRENAELRAANVALVQRALIAEEMFKQLEKERSNQIQVMEAMKAELDVLKRHVYGRRSETMPTIQRELQRKKQAKSDPQKERQRRKDNKEKKDELETQDVEHKVNREEEDACPNCGLDSSEFTSIGQGRETIVFEFVPARFVRHRHIQEVLGCPSCKQHIVVAKGPVKLGEGGGNYGPGFVAHLMVARALDAIPFYRMEKQFQRLDIPMARSTMVTLFHRYATELKPLVDLLTEQVAAADVVLADETPHKMQVKGDTGKDGKGYMWVFIAGNKVVYRFSPSRSGETPRNILGGSSGKLVVDAYTGYHSVTGPEGRVRAACMAHVRRKFFNALKSGCEEAQTALDYILDVYHVEHDAKEAGVIRKPEHMSMRRARSGPIMEAFHGWLLANQDRYPPKGAMGNAISHALTNWSALTEFLKCEQVPVDNNASEAALRIVALSRKNSLFVGHDEAGENLARVLTMAVTCQINGVNPQEYLADILLRVQTWPSHRIAELLPESWQRLKDAGELPLINAG